MKDNEVLRFSLKLIRLSGQNIANDTIINKIFYVLTMVSFILQTILGVLEPIKNFESMEKIPDYFEIVHNHYFVSMLYLRFKN